MYNAYHVYRTQHQPPSEVISNSHYINHEVSNHDVPLVTPCDLRLLVVADAELNVGLLVPKTLHGVVGQHGQHD